MWNLKYDTNEFIYKTERDSQREQTCGCQGGGVGEGWIGSLRLAECKLLYREWINNNVLLSSTGNYIQYLVINYNRKEYEKEYIYVYN